jgi:hypothetical protein
MTRLIRIGGLVVDADDVESAWITPQTERVKHIGKYVSYYSVLPQRTGLVHINIKLKSKWVSMQSAEAYHCSEAVKELEKLQTDKVTK